MNILLVYPKCPNTFWSFNHVLKYISKKSAYPPLGLLTVASLLPRTWEKRLVDLNVKELKDDDLKWADIVFVSAMIVQKESAKHVIDICKSQGKKVVCGGPLFSTQHEKFKDVDHFVLNEAEITLPLFIEDFRKGCAQKVYSSNDRPDITSTPTPMWSLVNTKDYASMLIQYSRGCPYNCEFCDIIIMNGRVPRTKTVVQMLFELQSLYDSGWRGSVFIVDDNFIGHKEKVKKLLHEIIDWQKKHKYPFRFITEASTNLADDSELMKLMSAANFHKVFLGIETPNIDSLHECSKTQNTERDLGEAVKTIQKHGLQVMGGFIVGFDNDTEDIFDTQIKFIQKIGVVTAMVGILTALPQTRLWHRLKAEGRLTKDSTADIDGDLNFEPKMGKEKLLVGYKKILSTIYSRKQYYRRINTFLKNYKPTVRGSRLDKSDIKALFTSMWDIGILSRARFLYWKLLIKTSVTKTRSLPLAIELAIYGRHFEKVTKGIVGA